MRNRSKYHMVVTIKLYSILKRYDPSHKGIIKLHVDDGATVGQVLEKIGIIRGEPEFIILNSKIVREDTTLRDGDVISLYPVAGGG